MDIKERFMSYVKQTNACWIWTGGKYRGGYGSFWMKPTQKRAHRISYELFRGLIPEGMYVLHHCDIPGCVNPDHLFLGNNSDNMRDAVAKKRQYQARKTHCPKEHPLFGDNLVGCKGHRVCKTCRDIRNREWKVKYPDYRREWRKGER